MGLESTNRTLPRPEIEDRRQGRHPDRSTRSIPHNPPRGLSDRLCVLMAGGLGRRLRPLTNAVPKPLLEISGKPVVQHAVEFLRVQGLTRFYFCVHYKADLFRRHFGDGSGLGVDIRYLEEDSPLGTAGPLTLLPRRPSKSFFVMNADLVTDLDLVELLRFHHDQGAVATMTLTSYDVDLPYGVVEVQDDRVAHIEERPRRRFWVNAGIYVLEPSVLELLSPRQPMDMPCLLDSLLDQGRPVAAFPISGYWRDIGQLGDFERAVQDLPILWPNPERENVG